METCKIKLTDSWECKIIEFIAAMYVLTGLHVKNVQEFGDNQDRGHSREHRAGF